MRTWPTILLKDYPLSQDWISLRPWWSLELHRDSESGDYHHVARRCVDDAEMGAPYIEGLDRSDIDALLLPQLASYDATHPLPHPGFRAGQVWALEFRNMLTTGVLNSVLPPVRGLIYDLGPAEIDAYAVGWTFGREALTRMEFEHLFCGKPLDNYGKAGFGAPLAPCPVPYLIADPCCPWLAPWSPAVPVRTP